MKSNVIGCVFQTKKIYYARSSSMAPRRHDHDHDRDRIEKKSAGVSEVNRKWYISRKVEQWVSCRNSTKDMVEIRICQRRGLGKRSNNSRDFRATEILPNERRPPTLAIHLSSHEGSSLCRPAARSAAEALPRLLPRLLDFVC